MARSEASLAAYENEINAGRVPADEAYYIRKFAQSARSLARTAADGAQARNRTTQNQKWEECRRLLLDMIDTFKELDRAVGGIQPEVYHHFMDNLGKYESVLRKN